MRKAISVITIISISLFLFLAGAWFLVKNDVIHFSFTDNWMRQKDYEEALERDVKVLVLGDSQLEKWPFTHCLYKDMAEYFDEQDIGYLNASHFGFGPIEYEIQLKEVLKYYTPDIILLFYYAGNDLGDVAYRVDNRVVERTYPVIFEEDYEVRDKVGNDIKKVKQEDQFDWALFKEQGMDDEIIDLAKKRIKHPNDLGYPYVNPHLLNLGSYKPNNLYDNCTLDAPGTKYGWYQSLRHFESIMQLADSIKAKVGIVVIPSNVQVDTSHYSFYRRAKFIISDDLLFTNAPQQILYDFSKASEIEYLDLLPFFKSYKNTDQLYIINDDHLSEQGHMLAFRITKDRMLDKLVSDTAEFERARKMNFYEKFQGAIVDNQMELIRQDTAWFKDIKEKARIENRSIEEQLYLDAVYILNNY